MRFRFIDFREYAGLGPGILIAVVVSIVAARRFGRWLATSPVLAGYVLFTFGLILAVTITPSREALSEGIVATGAFCDLSRLGPISLHDLFAFREPSLNVFLCVPLGVGLGLLPRSRRTLVVLGVALLTPIAVEALQGATPALGRVCESADVIDNVTGLAVGLVIGVLAGAIAAGEG